MIVPITLTQDAPTRLIGRTLKLRPGEYVTFPASILGRHRKAIIITNEDVNTRAYIVAGPAQGVDPATVTVRLHPIRVDQTIVLETSGEVTVKNVSGGEEIDPLHVLELIYE